MVAEVELLLSCRVGEPHSPLLGDFVKEDAPAQLIRGAGLAFIISQGILCSRHTK